MMFIDLLPLSLFTIFLHKGPRRTLLREKRRY